jgi:hypothetical protein
MSLGDEYKRFIAASSSFPAVSDAKLYIKRVENGSVVVEVIRYAQLVLPFIETTVVLLEFGRWLGVAYDWLLGKSNGERPDLDRADLVNLSKIVNPVAKDNGSQINVSYVHNGNIEYNFHLDSRDANASQNAVNREIASLSIPTPNLHEKVLMYWYQARNDPSAKTGDRVVIESISTKSVKVVFNTDELKANILGDETNFFHYAFVVDVSVETIRGVPAVYKVLRVYDKMEKPQDTKGGTNG